MMFQKSLQKNTQTLLRRVSPTALSVSLVSTAVVSAALVGFVALRGWNSRAETLLDPESVPVAGELGAPLADIDLAKWKRGRSLFDHDYRVKDGVGPLFNANTCAACHEQGALGGAGRPDLNVFRFVGHDEAGVQIALAGFPLLSRNAAPGVAREEAPEGTDFVEQRNSPPVFGSGLIEGIPDEVILSNADPDDADGDGISGKAHLRTNADGSPATPAVGRYGWKAQISNIHGFVLDAMANELGITAADDGSGLANPADTDAVSDPEISNEDVESVAFYILNLAPPARKTPVDATEEAQINAGDAVFAEIGCNRCHIPSLAGRDGPVAAYSDFLLHDVAPEGYVGIVDGNAAGREFRTSPLWGIRFSAPYMHDGSSETLRDAIRAHHAEADESTQQYELLSEEKKLQLDAFLQSL